MSTPLTLPTFVTQTYYVRDATASYDAPAFTVDASCPQTMYYTNSISANTWITGFTDNSGDGKLVSWQTNDET